MLIALQRLWQLEHQRWPRTYCCMSFGRSYSKNNPPRNYKAIQRRAGEPDKFHCNLRSVRLYLPTTNAVQQHCQRVELYQRFEHTMIPVIVEVLSNLKMAVNKSQFDMYQPGRMCSWKPGTLYASKNS
ncbi:hypothetical protein PROFUN_09450 [Planoprotostelium fungivorum]|uniref:Uncharacterized protein n=1 Tax=Planoprotostelium fungivorum TaxID=1890364 RepID=A0A2P6NH04_9EUKA|nr:hypothetical protein PROFUN_09450 [Planoprotostelium fungivorum]